MIQLQRITVAWKIDTAVRVVFTSHFHSFSVRLYGTIWLTKDARIRRVQSIATVFSPHSTATARVASTCHTLLFIVHKTSNLTIAKAKDIHFWCEQGTVRTLDRWIQVRVAKAWKLRRASASCRKASPKAFPPLVAVSTPQASVRRATRPAWSDRILRHRRRRKGIRLTG